MAASPATIQPAIRALRGALADGITQPSRMANQALANSNRNPGRNTYLWQDPEWTRAEAARVEAMPRGEGGPFGDGRDTLWGLPIAVKDCFDLAGAPTSCGVKFYRDLNGVARHDSWLVERLRAARRSHHRQDPSPSAGLWNYRREPGFRRLPAAGPRRCAHRRVIFGRMRQCSWRARRLPPSAPIRAAPSACPPRYAGLQAIVLRWAAAIGEVECTWRNRLTPWAGSFAISRRRRCWAVSSPVRERLDMRAFTQFGIVSDEFLHDCEPDVVAGYRETIADLKALGLRAKTLDIAMVGGVLRDLCAHSSVGSGRASMPVTSPNSRQAFANAWNGGLGSRRMKSPLSGSVTRSSRHAWTSCLPSTSSSCCQQRLSPRLAAGADHSNTRKRLLRYTTPFSLAGVPAVTIPCRAGGMQLAAAREDDEALLQLAAVLGARRRISSPVLNA